MGTKKRSSTKWMVDVLSSSNRETFPNLPPELLCGLRTALDVGLSCEQISSLLVLFAGIYEGSSKMSSEELRRRTEALATVMAEDISEQEKMQEQSLKNLAFKRERERLRKKAKQRRLERNDRG